MTGVQRKRAATEVDGNCSQHWNELNIQVEKVFRITTVLWRRLQGLRRTLCVHAFGSGNPCLGGQDRDPPGH